MRIHFLGIGGIGVSALARYYLAKGHEVSGSDLNKSEITDELAAAGAQVVIGPSGILPEDADLLIHSPAIPAEDPVLREAKSRDVKVQSYPEALGELTKSHYTIAVSGTHGKSTTTAMIGVALAHAGADPTVIVGTKVPQFGDTNGRVGEGTYEGKPLLVIEADEHFASFLNYYPDILVLTSLEEDHLDYYRDWQHILDTFSSYASHVRGSVIANGDDRGVTELLSRPDFPEIPKTLYSLKDTEAEELVSALQVPGSFNVSNALGAFHAARVIGSEKKKILEGLGQYKGSWRRFEIFELERPVSYTLVSDYGHHPTEVTATVTAAREKWPDRPIWLVFQPHQYNRTYRLFDKFVGALSGLPIQKLVLAKIYDVPGREDPAVKDRISSEILRDALLARTTPFETVLIPELEDVARHVEESVRGGEVVIVMGAGAIYGVTTRLAGN